MRNTLSKAAIVGLAAVSLTVSVFATTEPATAAHRHGGRGVHTGFDGGGFGWRAGGWGGGGWWAPAVPGGVAAAGWLAAPSYGWDYGYGYGPDCSYIGSYCGNGYGPAYGPIYGPRYSPGYGPDHGPGDWHFD
jgi:hypothetical protein